mmetsp:Transcript_20073/g.42253  ORF Transcript_20073/g.42253 Transcript_20073/m.42253 type:complete len:568 (+) Transcript_20073:272-1975(+)
MKFTALITALLASSAYVESTPEPTSKPTDVPSEKPSLEPSLEPSLKPSAAPSDEPSLKPSAEPSLLPSLAPSDAPSLKPSAEPSLEPSLKPSASPSDVPSLQPTDVPSLTPSAQPSDAPSDLPSLSPSMAPSVSAAPSSTPSAPPTRPEPQIEIDFTGFCLNFVNSTLPVATYTNFYTILGDAMETEIINYLNPKLTTPGQRILSLAITEIDGNAVGRRLEERKLADSLTEVKYDLTFEQFCTRGNCDDATQLTQAALDFLITNVATLVNSTAFLQALKDDLVDNHGIASADLNGMEATQSGGCTPTFVVNSIFPMMYYPDWAGANTGCIADGNEDEYMRLNPEGYYLFDKLVDCCSRHYSWNYNECAGIDNAALGPDGEALYYPDWEGENKSCKNDGGQPEYMSNNPTAWMFETLEACCTARYSWNMNDCVGAAGATTVTGSNKWYPNWEDFVCVQDCVGDSPCGGLAESWDPLYDTVNTCCDTKLNWVTECVTKSGGTSTGATAAAATTSGKWYVDYDTDTCKQDCVGSAPCGGAAESWEVLYDTVSACCQGKLWWVESCGPYAG